MNHNYFSVGFVYSRLHYQENNSDTLVFQLLCGFCYTGAYECVLSTQHCAFGESPLHNDKTLRDRIKQYTIGFIDLL